MHVLDPDALVHRLYLRRRERRHPDSHRVLFALGVDSHGVLFPHLVVDRRPGRGQPRAHDVRPGEHKLDRSFIGSDLGHHVRVLMEQPQRRQPGPVALAEKERGLVDDKDLDVVGAVFCWVFWFFESVLMVRAMDA